MCIICMMGFNIFNMEVKASVDNYNSHQNVFGYTEEDSSKITYDEIEEAVNNVKNEKTMESKSAGGISFNIDTSETSGAYVEYSLEDLMITKYGEGASFRKLLSDSYVIKVPYITTNGENAVMVYHQKKLKQLLPEK